MNKSEFIEALASKLDISKKDSANVLDTFIDCVSDGLVNGSEVSITGFGKWSVKRQEAKEGVINGKPYSSPAKNVVKFTVGKALKDKVNT